MRMTFARHMTGLRVHTVLMPQRENQVKFMNISTEHISQCNQSEPLVDGSGKMVDLMNENDIRQAHDWVTRTHCS